mmetsp:Transcript_10624/g.25533  ORF Transcript_10624/g.25533 Transcript_10624/m.25533 type:complete len:255 (-) Transcript_10624:452-1216(-)
MLLGDLPQELSLERVHHPVRHHRLQHGLVALPPLVVPRALSLLRPAARERGAPLLLPEPLHKVEVQRAEHGGLDRLVLLHRRAQLRRLPHEVLGALRHLHRVGVRLAHQLRLDQRGAADDRAAAQVEVRPRRGGGRVVRRVAALVHVDEAAAGPLGEGGGLAGEEEHHAVELVAAVHEWRARLGDVPLAVVEEREELLRGHAVRRELVLVEHELVVIKVHLLAVAHEEEWQHANQTADADAHRIRAHFRHARHA